MVVGTAERPAEAMPGCTTLQAALTHGCARLGGVQTPHLLPVSPSAVCRSWITLALTQEFSFPDALRLWDTLLSDPAGRTDCLLRLCIAMLLHVREELLQVRAGSAPHAGAQCTAAQRACRGCMGGGRWLAESGM